MYQYNRLCFGIASAPGLFQNLMKNILKDLQGVVVYFDDILVFGESQDEHNRNIENVLNRLEKNGLTVALEKCFFAKDRVEFLGFEIGSNGLHISPEKIKAISKLNHLANVTELKSFLGIINYYAKFIQNYASKAYPLYKLLKKNEKFIWNKNCDNAFKNIKRIITSHKVLVHYNPELPIKVTCEVSPRVLGAILSHELVDGTERPIASRHTR